MSAVLDFGGESIGQPGFYALAREFQTVPHIHEKPVGICRLRDEYTGEPKLAAVWQYNDDSGRYRVKVSDGQGFSEWEEVNRRTSKGSGTATGYQDTTTVVMRYEVPGREVPRTTFLSNLVLEVIHARGSEKVQQRLRFTGALGIGELHL